MIDIRPETGGDIAAIHDLNARAFGGVAEARLVDDLRADGDVLVSLVAVDVNGTAIVGHVLFSPLPIQTNTGVIAATALAPLAVDPAWQRQGIGSRLVRAGLDACRALELTAAVVLGDPAYYGRFGFSAALARGVQSPYAGFGEAYMAIELTPGALTGVDGVATYAAAFARLDEIEHG